MSIRWPKRNFIFNAIKFNLIRPCPHWNAIQRGKYTRRRNLNVLRHEIPLLHSARNAMSKLPNKPFINCTHNPIFIRDEVFSGGKILPGVSAKQLKLPFPAKFPVSYGKHRVTLIKIFNVEIDSRKGKNKASSSSDHKSFLKNKRRKTKRNKKELLKLLVKWKFINIGYLTFLRAARSDGECLVRCSFKIREKVFWNDFLFFFFLKMGKS